MKTQDVVDLAPLKLTLTLPENRQLRVKRMGVASIGGDLVRENTDGFTEHSEQPSPVCGDPKIEYLDIGIQCVNEWLQHVDTKTAICQRLSNV